ncbi:uncharacterized protein LOC129613241 [Condylostylus longicornis]|uniref:uncharacterized protein LOC129613241 n=1 Tax=Condylostylus longicornis TaxID=2530218 RepID=UPI00244E53A3|nr:uncharacterized protein LOC129613241 [Condylostylus longicornis]
MFQVGVTSKCEAANGMSIPCDGSHKLPVKKTYIDCTEGHFNGGQEILECDFSTGQWSRNPVRCFSHCDGDPNGIELFDEKTKFKWYAEILKRPPINGEINVFPGVILSSRLIMTLEKFFDPTIQRNFVNYVVRIYRPGSYQDYTVDRIEYKNDPVYLNDGTPKFDRMCMVVLSHENYIKIDEITRPTCLNYARESIFNENRWFMEVMRAKPEYK